MSQPQKPNPPNSPIERAATVLETDEDVRQAILANLKGRTAALSPEPSIEAPQQQPSSGRAASPFRPTSRPPIAILTVFDDGKTDGETIRLRDQRFIIGRTEGDFRIPLDGRISSRHVEITLQTVGGLHRWVVTDLQSTHGMYVRVSRTILADKAEFLVGNGRYRFDGSQGDASATAPYTGDDRDFGTTQGWTDGAGALRPAALTELIGSEIGNRVLLVKPEYWIGNDPSCAFCRANDPFCEPRHARVYRSTRGGWHVEHSKTQNGLWLRMPQIVVESMVQFQIGEQRFRLRVP